MVWLLLFTLTLSDRICWWRFFRAVRIFFFRQGCIGDFLASGDLHDSLSGDKESENSRRVVDSKTCLMRADSVLVDPCGFRDI